LGWRRGSDHSFKSIKNKGNKCPEGAHKNFGGRGGRGKNDFKLQSLGKPEVIPEGGVG